MILFYREPNGDYLAVDTDTADYYRQHLGRADMESRAAGIAGKPSSVCTCAVSHLYLRDCCKVAKANVPFDWREAIGW